MGKNSKPEQPIVILLQDENGDASIFLHGNVKVLWVDEANPKDRVYEMKSQSSLEEINGILGDSKIGHYGDGSPADIRAKKFEKELDGESHLSIVKDENDE